MPLYARRRDPERQLSDRLYPPRLVNRARATKSLAEHQAYCDDPSEPALFRAIVACGITPRPW